MNASHTFNKTKSQKMERPKLHKITRKWPRLACVECPSAGLMLLRDSTAWVLHKTRARAHKNLQIVKNDRFALGRQQLLFSLRIFLVEKFQMIGILNNLCFWFLPNTVVLLFSRRGYNLFRLAFVPSFKSMQSFHSEKETRSKNIPRPSWKRLG